MNAVITHDGKVIKMDGYGDTMRAAATRCYEAGLLIGVNRQGQKVKFENATDIPVLVDAPTSHVAELMVLLNGIKRNLIVDTGTEIRGIGSIILTSDNKGIAFTLEEPNLAAAAEALDQKEKAQADQAQDDQPADQAQADHTVSDNGEKSQNRTADGASQEKEDL